MSKSHMIGESHMNCLTWNYGLEGNICSEERWDGLTCEHWSWMDLYYKGEKVSCGIPKRMISITVPDSGIREEVQ